MGVGLANKQNRNCHKCIILHLMIDVFLCKLESHYARLNKQVASQILAFT